MKRKEMAKLRKVCIYLASSELCIMRGEKKSISKMHGSHEITQHTRRLRAISIFAISTQKKKERKIKI